MIRLQYSCNSGLLASATVTRCGQQLDLARNVPAHQARHGTRKAIDNAVITVGHNQPQVLQVLIKFQIHEGSADLSHCRF